MAASGQRPIRIAPVTATVIAQSRRLGGDRQLAGSRLEAQGRDDDDVRQPLADPVLPAGAGHGCEVAVHLTDAGLGRRHHRGRLAAAVVLGVLLIPGS